MSSDPRGLLHAAAFQPSEPLDTDRVLRRARQLRRRRVGAGATVVVALLLPAAAAIAGLPSGEVRFADPAGTPAPVTPAADQGDDGCDPLPEPSSAPADVEPPEPPWPLPAPELDEEAARVVIDTAPEGVTLSPDAGVSSRPSLLHFENSAGGVVRVSVPSLEPEDVEGGRLAVRNGAVASPDVMAVEQWPSGVCAAVVRRGSTQIVFVAGGTVVNMMDHVTPDSDAPFLSVDEHRAWGQRIAAALTARSS